MIETRALQCFIALAEELHFSRTADRLNIARSVLSLQIQRLEDVLGAPLFERNRRSTVRLTRTGLIFLEEARDTIARLTRAEQIGRAASRFEAGPIRIGYIFSAAMNGILPLCLRALHECRPLLDIHVSPGDTPDQIEAVEGGTLDLGFVRPRTVYPDGIGARMVHREPLLLVHSDRHRLSRQKRIRPEDLAGESFLVPQLEEQTGLTRAVLDLTAANPSPSSIISTEDFLSAISMASADLGLVLAPQSLRCLGVDGVRYRDIDQHMAMVELALIHRTDDASTSLADFVAEAVHSGS